PAFGGRDRQELLRQIAHEEPAPPRRHDRAVPAELETIILKAMGKSPDERYASAQELADDRRRFLEDPPIRARRPTLLQRTRKCARRHRPVVVAVLVSAAVLLVTAVAALAVSTALVWQERARAQAAYEREAEAREGLEASLYFNSIALA